MAPRKKGEAEPAKQAHNMIDPAIRKDFLERRDHWKALDDKHKEIMTKAKKIAKDRKLYEQEIGNAGFTMAQIKVSLAVLTPEGEAEFKARMGQEMIAAAYAGAEVGQQLSLFFEPDRTPAVERAAREGQQAAMENKAHAPPYDPSVPQYKAWSDAFYAEQERQITGGIKKLDAKKAAANAKGAKGKPGPKGKKGPNADAPAGSERKLIKKADKDAAAAAKAPKPPEPPRTVPSAAPVTRATVKAQRDHARENAESYFTKAEPAGNA